MENAQKVDTGQQLIPEISPVEVPQVTRRKRVTRRKQHVTRAQPGRKRSMRETYVIFLQAVADGKVKVGVEGFEFLAKATGLTKKSAAVYIYQMRTMGLIEELKRPWTCATCGARHGSGGDGFVHVTEIGVNFLREARKIQ